MEDGLTNTLMEQLNTLFTVMEYNFETVLLGYLRHATNETLALRGAKLFALFHTAG